MNSLRRYRFFPSFDDDNYEHNDVANQYHVRKNLCIPAVNISEDTESFKLDLAAPGLNKEDFKINIEKDILEISANLNNNAEKVNENESDKILRREFCFTAFKRTFQLSNKIESDKIEASYDSGILRLTIPKREEAKEKPAKQIIIK